MKKNRVGQLKKLTKLVFIRQNINVPPLQLSVVDALIEAKRAMESAQYPLAENICYQILRQVFHEEVANTLVDSVRAQHDSKKSLGIADELVRKKKNLPYAHHMRAEALWKLGLYEESDNACKTAIKQNGREPMFHNTLGMIYKNHGYAEEAKACFERTLALDEKYVEAYFNLSDIKNEFSDDEINKMERVAADVTGKEKAYLYFSLYRAYEINQDYTKALQYLHQANKIVRQFMNYDLENNLAHHNDIARIVNKDFLQQRKASSAARSALPLFILGMPRSGSTLVERILDGHSDVIVCGEQATFLKSANAVAQRGRPEQIYPYWVENLEETDLQEIGNVYLEKIKADEETTGFYTDKYLLNYGLVGMIDRVFPDAPIIHCYREPMDLIFGCYRQYFQQESNAYAFIYDIEEMVAMYKAYRELMAHWELILPGRIFHLAHRSLVYDTEATVHSLLDYCGLSWQSECLEFHKSNVEIRTSSQLQVRQPINAKGIDRWRHYEQYFSKFKQALSPYRE